jgi:hypothetical protein
MEKWTKYTYVCDPNECDSLIEYTCKDTFGFPSGSIYNMKCPCGRVMQLLSYEDATISPNLEKEEQIMETATPTFMEEQIRILQDTLKNHTNCDYWKAENGRVQSQIIDVVDEIYAGNWSDVEDIASTLCEIIDYNPVKEIEFTATIRFTGRMEIPSAEYNSGGYNLSDILGDAYVDINNGDIVIDGYELEDAEEC